MKIVVFGLTLSSSWGNGHATLWRGLCRALHRRGHRVVFFERDVPHYAAHRDLQVLGGTELVLYDDFLVAAAAARHHLADADIGMITSHCPDGIAASQIVLDSRAAVKVFYDLDPPVTLDALSRGEELAYIGPRGLCDFDLVLSFGGGPALKALREQLGATRTAPLHGHVDPVSHRPVAKRERFAADLSYLGTYARDRQPVLDRLFLQPARQRPSLRFTIGGAKYPGDFPWLPNIGYLQHVAPADHPAFFSSSRFTLNVTRKAIADMGHCPSVRLFEAAACGVPVISDDWPGLEQFFAPGREIIVAKSGEDILAALDMNPAQVAAMAEAAAARVMEEHTSDHRVVQLEAAIQACFDVGPTSAVVGQ